MIRAPSMRWLLACGDARRSGKEAGEVRFEKNRARTAVYWTECGQAAPGGAGAAGESFIAAGDPARGRPVTTARGLWLQPIGQAGAAKGAARLGASGQQTDSDDLPSMAAGRRPRCRTRCRW